MFDFCFYDHSVLSERNLGGHVEHANANKVEEPRWFHIDCCHKFFQPLHKLHNHLHTVAFGKFLGWLLTFMNNTASFNSVLTSWGVHSNWNPGCNGLLQRYFPANWTWQEGPVHTLKYRNTQFHWNPIFVHFLHWKQDEWQLCDNWIWQLTSFHFHPAV